MKQEDKGSDKTKGCAGSKQCKEAEKKAQAGIDALLVSSLCFSKALMLD